MGIYTSGSRRLQSALVVLVLFLYCGYRSWTELQYGLQGQNAVARVTQAEQHTETDKHGTPHKRLAIEYQFTEPSGLTRIGTDDVPLDNSAPTIGGAIDVQYRPGLVGESRLVGHDHLLAAAGFLAMLAAGLAAIGIGNALRSPAPSRNSAAF